MAVQERLSQHREKARTRAGKPPEAETGGKSDVQAKEGEVISASILQDNLPPIQKIRTNKLGGGDYAGHDHSHTTEHGHVHVHDHPHEHTDGTQHSHPHEHAVHDHPPAGQAIVTALYRLGQLAEKRAAVRAKVTAAESKQKKAQESGAKGGMV